MVDDELEATGLSEVGFTIATRINCGRARLPRHDSEVLGTVERPAKIGEQRFSRSRSSSAELGGKSSYSAAGWRNRVSTPTKPWCETKNESQSGWTGRMCVGSL